jgi:hypothetical protein
VVRAHAVPDRLHLVGRVQQIIGKLLHVLKGSPHQWPEDLFGNDLSFAPKRTGFPPSDLGGQLALQWVNQQPVLCDSPVLKDLLQDLHMLVFPGPGGIGRQQLLNVVLAVMRQNVLEPKDGIGTTRQVSDEGF